MSDPTPDDAGPGPQARPRGHVDELTVDVSPTVRDLLRPAFWPVLAAVCGLTVVVAPSGGLFLVRVVAAVAVAFLLGAALVVGVRAWRGGRRRRVRIAADRLERVGPNGVEFGAAWDEVEAVVLRTGRARRRGALRRFGGPKVAVLELVLASGAARAAGVGDGGRRAYRLSLGSRPRQADRAREALEAHAPDAYAGLRDVERVEAADLL